MQHRLLVRCRKYLPFDQMQLGDLGEPTVLVLANDPKELPRRSDRSHDPELCETEPGSR